MCENEINNCGCTQPCNCSCPPAPCEEGCLTDTKTDCVFLSQDLDICSEVLEKGSTVTEAFAKLGEAVCDGITVTVQDMKVKVDANDTTSGYLFDKLTVCDNLTKTVTNVNGNETLRLCNKIDSISGSGDNILTSGPNGLYVPPASLTGYNLTPLFSNSVLLTVNPVLGGQSILATVKRDIVSGGGDNILQIGANGLYVPPPSTIAQTIVAKTNIPNSGIESFVTVASNVYTISSKIKLDPSSTAPISLTADGLKVDCCAPAASPNTPISIVLPSDSCLNMTATGIDSHTVTASVKVDTVSGGNALVKGPNGLYCPAPGAASPTSIQGTPTVNATLINPTTYSLKVNTSSNSCNALVLGTDGALYVNGTSSPYGLDFFVDGSDVYFQFQGPSTNNVNYEVELQGTTGSPQAWIVGSFDHLDGVILIYGCTNTSNTETVRARVRYKCGTNYSQWVSATYTPQHSYVSDTNTITIAPAASGVVGQYTIDTNCNCVQFNPGFTYGQTKSNYIVVDTAGLPSNATGLEYEFTVGGVLAGQGILPSAANSYKLLSAIEITNGAAILLRFRTLCTSGCISAWGSNYGTNAVISSYCNNDWTSVPSLAFISGAGYTTLNYTVPFGNPVPAYYKNRNGEFKLAGDCIVSTTLNGACNTGGDQTGWIDILDISTLNCNPMFIIDEDYGIIGFGSINGLVDYECGIINNSLAPSFQTVYARRRGNMIQVNIANQDMQSVTAEYVIPLSALNIHL